MLGHAWSSQGVAVFDIDAELEVNANGDWKALEMRDPDCGG